MWSCRSNLLLGQGTGLDSSLGTMGKDTMGNRARAGMAGRNQLYDVAEPAPFHAGSQLFRFVEDAPPNCIPPLPLKTLLQRGQAPPALIDELSAAVEEHCRSQHGQQIPRAPALLTCFALDDSWRLHYRPKVPLADEGSTNLAGLLLDVLDADVPLAMPEFCFDPAAYPAATHSVFVVSSTDFPDEDSWLAFCDANQRADVALATLNQLAAKFIMELSTAISLQRGNTTHAGASPSPTEPHASGRSNVFGTIAVSGKKTNSLAQSLTGSSTANESSDSSSPAASPSSSPILPPTAWAVTRPKQKSDASVGPSIESDAALAACVTKLALPDSDLLVACPLTLQERMLLQRLCKDVASAACLKPSPLLSLYTIAVQCDKVRHTLDHVAKPIFHVGPIVFPTCIAQHPLWRAL